MLVKGTFAAFMYNFDRDTRQQSVNQFLGDIISSSQRFCPLCLHEASVYKLIWRFTTIEYCNQHQCELCETCPNCNQTIPFIEASNGVCPSCKYTLKDTPIQIGIPAEKQEPHARNIQNFGYLLSPKFKMHSYLRQMMVGRTLREIRKFNQINTSQMATVLGTLPRVIERGIEGPRIGNGETFEMYHKQAEYFGYSIGELFRMVDTHLISDDTTIFLRPTIEFDWGNWEVKTVVRAAEKLARSQRDWSLTTFQAELGDNYQKLSKFPLALAIIDSFIKNDKAMDFVVKAKQ